MLTRAGSAVGLPAGPGVPAGVPSEVIVGIRPEHARLWHDGVGLVGPIEGRAEYVEMAGRETFIGVETLGDAHLTLLAEPDATVRQGEPVRFGFEPGRLYLFDTETQQAIARV